MLRHTNASRAKTLNATHSSVKTVFTTSYPVALRTDHVKLIKDEADVHLYSLGAEERPRLLSRYILRHDAQSVFSRGPGREKRVNT